MQVEGGIISVLIVDDSVVIRRCLREIFAGCDNFDVVGEAATGRAAIELACQLEPTLITMDLDLPEGDGLVAIEQIMALAPTRILVVTSVPTFRGLDATFEAMSRGALDLMEKPAGLAHNRAEQQRLIRVAERLSTVTVLPHTRGLISNRKSRRETRHPMPEIISDRSLVAIGASTGGPKTIAVILQQLPADFPVPIIYMQHLTEIFATNFIQWLDGKLALRVREATGGKSLRAGTVHVAIRTPHVAVTARGTIEEDHQPPRTTYCPSIDVLFESVAENYGGHALGVLLTGMGRDGAAGLEAIRRAGGGTVAQDEGSSVVFGMPQAAIDLGAAQHVLSADGIAAALLQHGGDLSGLNDRRS